jgi:hypothetical protein
MATRKRFVFAAMWLISAMASAQSGMAGKWTGEEQAGGGAVPVVLQLSVNSSGVTGSVIVGENPAQPISDARIDGNNLTFKSITMLNGKETPILWEGERRDDELTLVRTFGTGGRKLPPMVLRRSSRPAQRKPTTRPSLDRS